MDITEHKKVDEESEKNRVHLEELVKDRTAELTRVNEQLQKEIEELKRSETGIKSSEERLKILFEYAPDAYYLNDLKGYFIDGNKAAENLVGYKRDELIGKSFLKLKLLPAKQITKAAKLLAKNAIGKPTGPDEFTIMRKDGNQIPVEIRTFPIKIDNKSLVLGIARDITERRRSEEQINASLKEKEVLLKEIHHRVKNNLQVISSLLYLQSTKVGDKKALQMFSESQNRVRSMALIHEKLYQSKDMASIDFAKYVQSLTSYLFYSYGVKIGTISKKLDVDHVLLGVDKAIPCGLIINELVSNSLKYAFPNGNKGEINIRLYSDNDNHIVMNIDDNGVGLPKGLDFQKTTETLGLQLVNILIRQLKGSIKLDQKEGTRYEIVFMK